MEISSLSTEAGAAGVSAATSTEDTGVLSSDFETFLVMLTAQLQNQDPMNPMDSSDYAVQLATFSGVEQQVLTNELLRDLGGQEDSMTLATLASWVGLEAFTDGTTYYDGAPIDYNVDVPANADWAQLVIRSESGAEVNAIGLGGGSSTVTWDGTWADGSEAASGTYVAEMHYYTGGEDVPIVAELAAYTRIVEVRQSDSGLEVVLEGGTVKGVADVTGLRSPQA